MKLGLQCAGYKYPNRCKIETNINRFKAHFGLNPSTCEKLWVDLQATANEEGRIDAGTEPVFLLIGLRFLYKYETEEVLGRFFDMCDKTVRKYYRESAKKISLLFDQVILPVEAIAEDACIFALSIDGTHCPIEEEKPWDSKWSSKKLGKKAGVAYEVGMRIHKPELAWVAGPFPAGSHTDVVMFREELKGKLDSLNASLPVKKSMLLTL